MAEQAWAPELFSDRYPSVASGVRICLVSGKAGASRGSRPWRNELERGLAEHRPHGVAAVPREQQEAVRAGAVLDFDCYGDARLYLRPVVVW